MELSLVSFGAEVTAAEGNSLHLDGKATTLHSGERELLTITPIVRTPASEPRSLGGSVSKFEDPFGSAATEEDWDA